MCCCADFYIELVSVRCILNDVITCSIAPPASRHRHKHTRDAQKKREHERKRDTESETRRESEGSRRGARRVAVGRKGEKLSILFRPLLQLKMETDGIRPRTECTELAM